MERKNCIKCGGIFVIKRNPNQIYCSQLSCQKARKNFWRTHKRREDLDYQENHRISNKKWRKKQPGYWHEYRKTHPAYTKRNREHSRHRKRQRALSKSQAGVVSRFAKSDALLDKNLIKSGYYALMPVHGRFAKSDALTVKISLITGG